MKTKKASLAEKDFLDQIALIRSIQRAEGNSDCYRSGQVDCDEMDCAWRKYCLEEPEAYPLERHKHRRREKSDKLTNS